MTFSIANKTARIWPILFLIGTTACLTGNVLGAECTSLHANTRPIINEQNIKDCLAGPLRAVKLSGETFVIKHSIIVTEGATLEGERGTVITTHEQDFVDSALIKVSDESTIQNLSLHVSKLSNTCCSSAITIAGRGSHVDHITILGPQRSVAKEARTVGIYFMGGSETVSNIVEDTELSNFFFGVIFDSSLVNYSNIVQRSVIHDIDCDGVVFAGPGTLLFSRIEHVGQNCAQRPYPIPGAGIYSAHNKLGMVVIGNSIRRTCGSGIDLENDANLKLQDNSVLTETELANELPLYCVGRSNLVAVDITSADIRNNRFTLADLRPLAAVYKFFPSFYYQYPSLRDGLGALQGYAISVRILSSVGPLRDFQFVDNVMTALNADPLKCASNYIGLLVLPQPSDSGILEYRKRNVVRSPQPPNSCK